MCVQLLINGVILKSFSAEMDLLASNCQGELVQNYEVGNVKYCKVLINKVLHELLAW